jgi:ketol-acid reductoisomerase
MVVGFNHNFRYKGEVYHIQTEDSGLKSPNIVTLLYQGGTILGSKKTSYADIAKVDNLEQVVEELMKEQHKGMLRSLKTGEYDEVIDRFQTGKKVIPKEEKATAPAVVAPPASRPLEPVR